MINDKKNVVIVGRPNVGKSCLFNRLTGRRVSIVHSTAGITRDIVIEKIKNDFLLIDTGGIGLHKSKVPLDIIKATQNQLNFALKISSIIIFVVDGRAGLTSIDKDISNYIRKYNKPIIYVINKLDNSKHREQAFDCFDINFPDPILCSAEHGYNVNLLLKRINILLKNKFNKIIRKTYNNTDKFLKFSLIGRPNVGKSSIGNCILSTNRLIVSETLGTTSNSISVNSQYKDEEGNIQKFQLIDTAGLKAKNKINSSLEYFSSLRSNDVIRKADIIFQVIDAEKGITKLDKKIIDYVASKVKKNFIIIVNKWDKVLKKSTNRSIQKDFFKSKLHKEYVQSIKKKIPFLSNFSILFTSAKQGIGLNDIIKEAFFVYKESTQKFRTSEINKVISEILSKYKPRIINKKCLKIYYAVQVGFNPIRIRIFCNNDQLMENNYEKYLKKELIKNFKIIKSNIVLEFISK